MIAQTWRSPLDEEFIGGTWYQRVYSHNQAWPGKFPVSFIMPH